MGGTRWGSPRSSPLLIVRDLRKLSSLHPVLTAHLPSLLLPALSVKPPVWSAATRRARRGDHKGAKGARLT